MKRNWEQRLENKKPPNPLKGELEITRMSRFYKQLKEF